MLRALLHYFLIGGLLFGGKALLDRRQSDGPEITVRVPLAASQAEIDRSTREAILLNETRRHGWDRRDPIVYSHLVRNMRFIEPESTESDSELYLRALDMDMHGHDPIVRARLLYRAREALAYVPDDRMPTRRDLVEYSQENAERFEREGSVRFQQVFLSGSKRGEALAAEASAMRDRLAKLEGASPKGIGDPLPGLRSEQSATPSKVRAEYGDELASLLEEDVLGVWRGPVSSVYGLHFIKVISREPDYVPSLDVIGPEVRADLLRDIREELQEERMDALRDEYTVHVERLP